ncbi:MAG TPA: hypothetical protein VLW54_03330 [Candidatus Acidoferrales bacterium]|nr:hypothetical protein [Candidatus Acidoferrales bacterium]
MSPGVENPLDGIRADIQLLRDQVDELQIAAAEKRKPWHKQPSILISVIALLISTSSGIAGYIVQLQKDDVREKAEKLANLQQLTIDIVDTGKQMADLDQKDTAKVAYLTGLLNAKREIMVSQASELARQFGYKVPAEILYEVGTQQQADGRTKEAEALYSATLSQNPTEMTQIAARRSLATLYMNPPATLDDLRKGREQFQTVIDLVNKRKDDAGKFERGFTYEVWGGMEFINDQLEPGKQAYARAREAYESLSPANGNRQPALYNLSLHKQANFLATSEAKKAMSHFVGNWVSGGSNPTKLRIILTPSGYLMGTLSPPSSSETGGLLPGTPFSGSVILEDDTSANFVWTVPANLYSPTSSTTGMTKLELNAARNELRGEHVVNGIPTVLVLHKILQNL